MKNTTETGRFGEDIACKHLKKNKYRIVAKNYRASHNELDVIAENKQYIVFVEVKTRTLGARDGFAYGTPASAVTYSKQKRTVAAARDYLRASKCEKQPRFDVIEVILAPQDGEKEACVLEINHIEAAFTE